MFHILIWGLGSLSGRAKPAKAPMWRRDWIRLDCQLVTRLEMMHILQAQVWSCISAHPGLPHQKTKRETNDASKSQLHQASWNRTILKFGSENQLNGRNYFAILFWDFPLIAWSGQSHVTISLIGRAPHTKSISVWEDIVLGWRKKFALKINSLPWK